MAGTVNLAPDEYMLWGKKKKVFVKGKEAAKCMQETEKSGVSGKGIWGRELRGIKRRSPRRKKGQKGKVRSGGSRCVAE